MISPSSALESPRFIDAWFLPVISYYVQPRYGQPLSLRLPSSRIICLLIFSIRALAEKYTATPDADDGWRCRYGLNTRGHLSAISAITFTWRGLPRRHAIESEANARRRMHVSAVRLR